MKKIILPVLLTMAAQTTIAGPTNQMEGYTPTNIASYEVQDLWEEMETALKGKDCYRRAQIWTYDFYQNHGIKSKKIFMHYTDKWNRELDNMGKDHMSWLFRKFWSADGVSKRIISMVKNNITWDYHVAPMLVVDGKNQVFDKQLHLPYAAASNPATYSEASAFSLSRQVATPEEWVEALTVRGELLWQARKADMKEKLQEAIEDEEYEEAVELRRKMKQLGMDKERIDIKCKKVDSIAEVDQNHETAWCFWSEAPMYYYNEIDLRNLAYGMTGYRYTWAPPLSVHTEENYQAGRAFIQTRFNPEEIEDAQKERTRKKNTDEEYSEEDF